MKNDCEEQGFWSLTIQGDREEGCCYLFVNHVLQWGVVRGRCSG